METTSTSAAHTAGPWIVNELKYTTGLSELQIASPSEELCIAVTPRYRRGSGDLQEAEANANLIAKAWLIPALVITLEDALTYACRWDGEANSTQTEERCRLVASLKNTIAQAA
jgi:hypothetical protein